MQTRVFRDFKFELPSGLRAAYRPSRELVDNPAGELQKLLAEHQKEERVVARQLVQDFAARFGESHKLNIRFTDAAADRLVAQALEQSVPVRDLCSARFKDYHSV